jgi:HlyD family secretion protein
MPGGGGGGRRGNGAGAGPAGAEGGRGAADSRRMVWVLRGGKPAAIRIRTGVSDGSVTEVMEGDLQPGDACVTDASGGAGGGGGKGPGGPRGPRIL